MHNQKIICVVAQLLKKLVNELPTFIKNSKIISKKYKKLQKTLDKVNIKQYNKSEK